MHDPPIISIDGQRKVISRTFSNPVEACNFYKKDSFKIDYPYIVIDKNINETSNIRAITYEASWKGEECKIKDNRVELYGEEKTLHEIEIKLPGEIDYKHVANGYGLYKSIMIFDSDGRIITRKTLSNNHLNGINSKYESLQLEDIERKSLKSKLVKLNANSNDISDDNDPLNLLLINPVEEINSNDLGKNGKYYSGITEYLHKRQKLHEKLGKGCGVISTTPENITGHFHKTTIAFLCQTHARVMIREP